MQCPYCGQVHPDAARFCPASGQALPEASPVLHLCPECQHPVKLGVPVCPACGHNLAAVTKPRDAESNVVEPVLAEPATGISRNASVPIQLARHSGRAISIGLILLGLLGMTGGAWVVSHNLSTIGAPEIAGVSPTVMLLQVDRSSGTPSQVLTEASDAPPEPASTPSQTPSPSSTPVSPPSPTPTPTEIPSPTPTLPIGIIPEAIQLNPIDNAEMVLVPAGEFLMGADPGSLYYWGAEAPQHKVRLDEFWIYRTEVTNGMYRACVEAKMCPRPAKINSPISDQYGDPRYDNYPVVLVSYNMATAYCKWTGGRLPTEAEWEKAARGSDGRMFPWGDGPAKPDLANYGANAPESVGSYPAGASPYGALDMAGNVLEWVFDAFKADYYRTSPLDNPRGPSSGDRRVIRGGAYHHLDQALRAAARASLRSTDTNLDLGFRCAMDAE